MFLAVVLLALASVAVDGGSLIYQSRDDNSIPWSAKKPAEPLGESAAVGDVICPDQQSSCPDGSTCCQMASGAWGCCPIVAAVCCTDHLHCCPSGYTCDVQHGSCLQKVAVPATRRPGVEPTSPAPSYGPVNVGTACPGGTSCPLHAACCRTYHNTYNCCNYPLNVCCDDGIHCCSPGSICQQPTLSCITVNTASATALESVKPAAVRSVDSSVVEN